MRRPAVRFLLTLAIAASVLGVVPATSEAGIVPWAWDTLFGPVGSIQARRVARYGYGGGGCCGPVAPVYAGFRGGWGSYSGGCCAPACGSCGGGCGIGGCGTGCNSCGGGYGYASGGCSSCGTGYGGAYYDGGYYGGYAQSACGAGGCANGQCNVNYPPGQNPPAGGSSPVTPAPAPAPGPNPNAGGAGPSPAYDNRVQPPAAPNGANDNFVPPVTPPPSANGVETNEGFKPATTPRTPAPNTADPAQTDAYQPPNTPSTPASTTEEQPTDGGTPAVPAPVPKKPKFGGDDDDKASVGPRFELNEKVTWRPSIQRTRTNLSAVRVSATANRYGMFAKTAWRSGADTNLAKK